VVQRAKAPVLPQPPIPEPDTAVMTLTSLARDDVPGACERLRALIGACDADVVVCDVGELEADLTAVEVLARLRLTAQRLGCALRLRGPSRALEQMLAFCGLCDVLPVEGEPGGLGGIRWYGGQAEEREQPVRVEEGVEARDPPV
jgi:ABC-type transporter Mla MlaB component